MRSHFARPEIAGIAKAIQGVCTGGLIVSTSPFCVQKIHSIYFQSDRSTPIKTCEDWVIIISPGKASTSSMHSLFERN
jgi:hypothetical protein